MRLVYKFSLALFCLAISYASLHAEGWGEYNKTVKKEFAISSNGTVYLANKYGKVDVKTWDRNRVKLDIRIYKFLHVDPDLFYTKSQKLQLVHKKEPFAEY